MRYGFGTWGYGGVRGVSASTVCMRDGGEKRSLQLLHIRVFYFTQFSCRATILERASESFVVWCNTLHHTATRNTRMTCGMAERDVIYDCFTSDRVLFSSISHDSRVFFVCCSTLQHTATHNTRTTWGMAERGMVCDCFASECVLSSSILREFFASWICWSEHPSFALHVATLYIIVTHNLFIKSTHNTQNTNTKQHTKHKLTTHKIYIIAAHKHKATHKTQTHKTQTLRSEQHTKLKATHKTQTHKT